MSLLNAIILVILLAAVVAWVGVLVRFRLRWWTVVLSIVMLLVLFFSFFSSSSGSK